MEKITLIILKSPSVHVSNVLMLLARSTFSSSHHLLTGTCRVFTKQRDCAEAKVRVVDTTCRGRTHTPYFVRSKITSDVRKHVSIINHDSYHDCKNAARHLLGCPRMTTFWQIVAVILLCQVKILEKELLLFPETASLYSHPLTTFWIHIVVSFC